MIPRYLSDDAARSSDNNFINDGEISEASWTPEKKVSFFSHNSIEKNM